MTITLKLEEAQDIIAQHLSKRLGLKLFVGISPDHDSKDGVIIEAFEEEPDEQSAE